MKRNLIKFSALLWSTSLWAGTMGMETEAIEKHFFMGLGGSYNAVSLNKQTVYGKGVNTAYTGPILTSTGSAAGTSNPFYQNETPASPHGQIGYIRHFGEMGYFWGAKISYDYLNTHFSDNDMTIPQAGSNHNALTGETSYFNGNYAVESVQTSVNHELLLLWLMGHSYDHGNVYLGLGPTVLEVSSNIYHIVGYADYKGMQGTNISGAPVNLGGSSWSWGGAAQLGITYTFTPTCFLDFNYTYAAIPINTFKYVSPFTNEILPDHLVGTSYIHSSQRVAAQSFTVSVNKVF